ncbi:uncharacterized protein K02A2.6 [Tachysurus ichikawai]
MVRMKEIARSYFWWPGVNGQIEEKARTCTSCQRIRNAPQLAPRCSSVLARNYGSGPKWVPATVAAQTGLLSYKVKTDENLSWRRHTGQLLGGASTVTDLPEVNDAIDQIDDNSLTSVVSTNEPMMTTNAPFANEPSSSPAGSGNQIGHRYPVREWRPPQHLLDYT